VSQAHTGRRGPAVALLVLLAALALALAVAIPWTTLPEGIPAGEATADFTASEIAREVGFHNRVRPWSYSALALGLVVAAVLGLTPLGARLVTAVGRPLPARGRWAGQVLLGVLAVALVGRLATLPLRLPAERILRDVGLSTQTWTSWAADVLRSLLVGAVVTGLVLLLLVWLARRLPRLWWAAGATAVAGAVVVGSFAYPSVVEPLFNDFRPLPPGELRDDLLALAARDGIEVDEVLVADASRRTTALNAYVSGFAGSRRIVVYDTLLAQAAPAEIELVVAHELGHAEHRDVLVGTLLGALAAAAAVCALALALSFRPLLRRAGASGMGDPRVVPLVLLLVAVMTLLTSPVVNLVSRKVEARADLHALELTGEAEVFVESQRRLALTNLADLQPHPLAYAFFASHPSVTERLALARAWERQR
jgi:STE24 endopeptidase